MPCPTEIVNLIVVFVCIIFVVKFWYFFEPILGLECHSCIIKQLFLFSCLSFVIAVIWKPFGLDIYSQTSALNMKIESFKSITYTFFLHCSFLQTRIQSQDSVRCGAHSALETVIFEPLMAAHISYGMTCRMVAIA